MPQSGNRRLYDPADRLSMADQAIEEMNARREAYAVQARFKAKEAEQAARAASDAATAAVQVGDAGDVADIAAAPASTDAVSAASSDATASAQKATPALETAPVDSGVVRWSVMSFALLGASVVFLVVALAVS